MESWRGTTILCVRKDGQTVIAGGAFAQAAALALVDGDKSAEQIVGKAMNIAADICIYTNHNIITEKL